MTLVEVGLDLQIKNKMVESLGDKLSKIYGREAETNQATPAQVERVLRSRTGDVSFIAELDNYPPLPSDLYLINEAEAREKWIKPKLAKKLK